MTDSIKLFHDAAKKVEEASEELARGATKRDHDTAKVIFEAMCAANLHHVNTAASIRHLAMASLLYAHAVLCRDMSAQATSKM
jgi:hypothetical protein